MNVPSSPAPENETARLLAETRRALRRQQEAATTSVHLAQAILRAFQQSTTLAQQAFARLPDGEVREHYAGEMTRITRALAGVVEEFSPGLGADPTLDLPEPTPAAPLPEDFYFWLRTQKGGPALPRGDAIASGRNLWSRAQPADRQTLLDTWRQQLRAKATALYELSTTPYATQ